MKISAKKSSWVVTILVAVLAMGYVWFVFLPGKRTIETLYQELLDKQMYAAQYGTIVAQTRGVTEEMRQAIDYVQQTETLLESSSDVSKLYAAIADVAQAAGVVTTRFSPESPVRLQRLQRLPLKVGYRGKFQDVRRVLEGLERLPHRIWVDDLSLEQDSENKEALVCELSLVVFAKISEKSD